MSQGMGAASQRQGNTPCTELLKGASPAHSWTQPNEADLGLLRRQNFKTEIKKKNLYDFKPLSVWPFVVAAIEK